MACGAILLGGGWTLAAAGPASGVKGPYTGSGSGWVTETVTNSWTNGDWWHGTFTASGTLSGDVSGSFNETGQISEDLNTGDFYFQASGKLTATVLSCGSFKEPFKQQGNGSYENTQVTVANSNSNSNNEDVESSSTASGSQPVQLKLWIDQDNNSFTYNADWQPCR